MTGRLLLLLVSVVTWSCDRDPAVVTRSVALAEFSQVEVLSDFAVTFVETDRVTLEVTGPEESVGHVTAEVTDGTLRIRTDEQWRWLSPKRARTTLTLYAPPLHRITISDGCSLSAKTPIRSGDFGVVFTGKSCEADLALAGGTFYYWTSSFTAGRLTLRGATQQLNLFNFGLAGVDASGLDARKALILNDSRGDVAIAVRDTLTYTISGTGDIRLAGRPVEVLSAPISGDGRLVRE